MSIVFEPEQYIEIELPGGVYYGKIVEAVEGSGTQWVIEIKGKK